MKSLTVNPASRLQNILKLFFILVAIGLVINVTVFVNYFELWKKIGSENLMIQSVQQQVNNLVQQKLPFSDENYDNFDKLTEKERAELLGLDDGITDEIRHVMKELNITNAGENGTPVIINWNHSDYIRDLYKSMKKTYGYNALASSMISLNRALPDNRSRYCKRMKYPRDLPKASVVIPFHDDDWMLLMRTVHSVLLRTPDRLLEEILLVHDISDRDYYQERLDEYIKKFPKIRLIRSHKRQGIIPTRILGGRNAKGPIIVYLDSHVEVTPGWIEPMLARIQQQPNVLCWAKISRLSPMNMRAILNRKPGLLGSLRWDMFFETMDIKWYEGDNRTKPFEAKPTPTIIGPCYAIRKDFYHKLGYLDPDFDIWGGEDVELALRTWMCGGRVELIPCSVVAHMFKTHTYSMSTNDKGGVYYNNDRIAEIWLDDEYKKYYYRLVGHTKNRNYGNITERLELKKKLKCKSFKWFLENVHPKMPIPEEIRDHENLAITYKVEYKG